MLLEFDVRARHPHAHERRRHKDQFDDRDRSDDAAEPLQDEGMSEETSALGERIKGRTKDIVGDLTDNERLEEEGEQENQAGRERQRNNDAI